MDEISWIVGYEDPASFRRLFKRITGVTAGAYRRKFRIPSFAPDHRTRLNHRDTENTENELSG